MASIIKIKRRSANPSNFNSNSYYVVGTKVLFGNTVYVASRNSTGSVPTISPFDWDISAEIPELPGPPSSLDDGELAFNEVDEKLYYGSSAEGGSVILIASTSSALLSGIHYGDGSNLTNISAVSPFNQDLDTNSSVEFNNITLTRELSAVTIQTLSAQIGNIFLSENTISTKNNNDIKLSNSLIPSNSAVDIGSLEYPIRSLFVAPSSFYMAPDTIGDPAITITNTSNTLTVRDGALRSTIIYTGGLLLSGNNIGADPAVGPLPLTIGTNGLPAVEFLVPIKLNSTVVPNISGNAVFSHNVSAVNFYGDGSHLTNVPNIFNQSLNSTNNVSFSSLNLADGLTAHNTVIIGTLSATGTIYASDIHAPFSVNNYVSSFTLALSDVDGLITVNSSSATILTVPNNSTVPFDIGSRIKIVQLGTAQITISAAVGVTVNSPTGYVKTAQRYSMIDLYKIATNAWLLAGDLSKN